MKIGDEKTYMGGKITVQCRADDFMAYVTGNTGKWEAGSTETEAVAKLVMFQLGEEELKRDPWAVFSAVEGFAFAAGISAGINLMTPQNQLSIPGILGCCLLIVVSVLITHRFLVNK